MDIREVAALLEERAALDELIAEAREEAAAEARAAERGA